MSIMVTQDEFEELKLEMRERMAQLEHQISEKPQKPQSKKSQALERVKVFAQSTTAHGLAHIESARNMYLALFWCLVVIGAATGFGIHIESLVSRYLSRPTSTNFNPIGAEFEYPDITFCNKDPVTISSYAYTYPQQYSSKEKYVVDIQKKAKTLWKFMNDLEELMFSSSAKNNSCYEYLSSHTYDGAVTEPGCSYAWNYYSSKLELFPDNYKALINNKCRDPVINNGYLDIYNYTDTSKMHGEMYKRNVLNDAVYYADKYLGCYKNSKFISGTVSNPFNLKSCAKSCWHERKRFMAVTRVGNGTVCSCGDRIDYAAWYFKSPPLQNESFCTKDIYTCGNQWRNNECYKRIYTISPMNGKPWCMKNTQKSVPKRKMWTKMNETPEYTGDREDIHGDFKECKSIPMCPKSTLPYKYIGCFIDHANTQFSVKIFVKPLSVVSCARACRRKGYRFMGLSRRGEQCQCGNVLSKKKYKHWKGCLDKCGGECGGGMFNSVYSLKIKETEANILKNKLNIIKSIVLDTLASRLMKLFSLSENNFILRCKIGEAECSHEDFVPFYSQEHFKCFTFDLRRFYNNNPNVSIEKTPKLDVMFYTDSHVLDYSNATMFYRETGTRVFYKRNHPGFVTAYIHGKGTYPHKGAQFEATSGFQTTLKLKQIV